MRNLLLLTLFSAFLQVSYGQIKSAQISYTMEYSTDEETGDDESMASFFEGSSMEIYFNSSNIRTDIIFGMLMDMKVILNKSEDKGIILMSTFGSNFAVPATLEQIMEKDEEQKQEVELVSGSKKILKYKCKKALQTDADGNITTIWYTEKFNIPVQYFGMTQDVPGLPLEIESNTGGIRIVFTATEIKKGEPENGTFDLSIPEDYEEMSYEEFSTMGQDVEEE